MPRYFGSPGPPAAAGPTTYLITTAPEGGWVWFGASRALRNGEETIAGYITGSSGDVKAIRIDNDDQSVIQTTTLYDNFIVDDHSPPSFVVRPDGIVMAAFAYHLGPLYVGIGTSPGVLPAQANVTNITSQVGTISEGAYGYTYASIFYLDDEDRYYIFARYHDSGLIPHVVFTYSDDDGATWAAHTLLQRITYHQITKNGTDRFDLVTSDHPLFGQGDSGTTGTSIFHLYYDGTWHKSDGSALTPEIGNTAATYVYNGSTERAWLWDIAIEADGQPRIVFVKFEDTYPSGPWSYWWARWTGAAWDLKEVADAGGKFPTTSNPNDEAYAGGIVLDHEDPNIVYYSSDAASGQFQVYRATTANDGASWTVETLTSNSAKNVRPVSVLGHDGRLAALWLTGTYTDYFTYSQRILGTAD